jgi:hypothetical protein
LPLHYARLTALLADSSATVLNNMKVTAGALMHLHRLADS